MEHFASFPSGELFLDNSFESDVANSYIGETLVRRRLSMVAFEEQGIRAIYRAIERAHDGEEANEGP